MATALAVVGLGILLVVATRAAEEPGQQAGSTQTKETATDKISDTANTAAVKVKRAAAVASQEMSDSWITLQTKLSLLADDQVRSQEVHVTTRQGIVTLRGKVRSEAARQAAVGDATKIDGVQRVESHLMVDSRAARKTIIGRMT
jgi:hyperosmotically inducible protein